jgi:hypothetical protein
MLTDRASAPKSALHLKCEVGCHDLRKNRVVMRGGLYYNGGIDRFAPRLCRSNSTARIAVCRAETLLEKPT